MKPKKKKNKKEKDPYEEILQALEEYDKGFPQRKLQDLDE